MTRLESYRGMSSQTRARLRLLLRLSLLDRLAQSMLLTMKLFCYCDAIVVFLGFLSVCAYYTPALPERSKADLVYGK
jgi:hypothetical protein